MQLVDDSLVYSASDLSLAATCEFALLRRVDVLLGRGGPLPAAQDAMLERTSRLGAAHEQRVLRRYLERHGPARDGAEGGVVVLPPGYPATRDELRAAHELTLAHLRRRPDVVYQATFFDGRFTGRADFLVRDGVAFTVVDTKLARHARVTALLQVTAYADQLVAAGVEVSDRVELVLGDETTARYRLADLLPVFRERRTRLERILDVHAADDGPVAWDDERFAACGRCEVCSEEVAAHRDLLLVANLRTSQRTRLRAAGVATIDELAASSGPVPGVSSGTLARLRAQAAAQVAQDERPELANGWPDVRAEVVDPVPLEALPAPDAGDVFFDFEGDPLWVEPGSTDWGLEYLFGVLEPGSGPGAEPVFRPFWAHDRDQEKRALLDFLTYVTERRRRHPGMHVYHYAPYERTALQRLVGRHGVGEELLDDLLRGGVLVDLYATVRQGLLVSQPSYSIKKLEPLYMDSRRNEDLARADDSIAEYALACDARDEGRAEEYRERLDLIADYNRYDCVSTLRLRDWLLGQLRRPGEEPGAAGASDPSGSADQGSDIGTGTGPGTGPSTGIGTCGGPGDTGAPSPRAERVAALTLVAQAVARPAEGTPHGERTDDEQALAMLGAAVLFHNRELKPFWWAHYARLTAPVEDWEETRDVLVVETGTVARDWHQEGRQRNPRRTVRLAGRLGAGSTVSAGDRMSSVYTPPLPGLALGPDQVRGIGGNVTVLETGSDDAGRDVVVVEEVLGTGLDRHDAIPLALVPGSPPPIDGLEGAIEELADQVLEARAAATEPASATGLFAQPALDVLRRVPPRLAGDAPLPSVSGGDDVGAITAAVRELDRSYLAVQGPPGTGKTYVGARVITRLVAQGWRIGVVAQSHAVVENLLAGVVEAGTPAELVGKYPGGDGPHPWTALPNGGEGRFVASHRSGCVVGGTAWVFANEKKVPRSALDLLVVDEAGQFSLANTIAVSLAARNLLLLGDPQQLPQVTQGVHPEPIDGSALGWVAAGHDALPPDRGYFLSRTYRMHPALCAPVSRLSYAGRLQSQEEHTTARRLEGLVPGLHVRTLDHLGNSVESPEEAEAVVGLVADLVGRPWHDGERGQRPLEDGDVLVVAAYNAQRALIERRLRAAGLARARVGTVDKFQGQQAPVVIVSMAASSVDDVPRGMDFLLMRNRINVAVSRGQWAAIIVRSRALTDFLPAKPDGLTTLGAFIGLCDAGSHGCLPRVAGP